MSDPKYVYKPGLFPVLQWSVGPSDDYRALLRGEIEADEYVRRVKASVNERMRSDRSSRHVLTRWFSRRLFG